MLIKDRMAQNYKSLYHCNIDRTKKENILKQTRKGKVSKYGYHKNRIKREDNFYWWTLKRFPVGL